MMITMDDARQALSAIERYKRLLESVCEESAAFSRSMKDLQIGELERQLIPGSEQVWMSALKSIGMLNEAHDALAERIRAVEDVAESF